MFVSRGNIAANPNAAASSQNRKPSPKISTITSSNKRTTASPVVINIPRSSKPTPPRRTSSNNNAPTTTRKPLLLNTASSSNNILATTNITTAPTSSVLLLQQQPQPPQSPALVIEERTAKQVKLPRDGDTKRMRRLLQGCKLFYSSFPRDCIEATAREELGMRRAVSMRDADLIWVEHNPLTSEGLRQVDAETQRVNCWVGMRLLATKCEFGLVMNLARSVMDPLRPSVYSFLPRTFVLPQDRDALLEYFAAASSTNKKNKHLASSSARLPPLVRGRMATKRWKSAIKTSASIHTSSKSDNGDDGDDDEFAEEINDDGTLTSASSSADSDLHRFYLKEMLKNASNGPVFIVKPDAGCGGDGIFLCDDIQNIPSANCVVQEYITNPLLLGGIKFDLRVYVLVTSVLPLRFYVHKEGLARMAVEKYEYPTKKNFHRLNMALTNFSLNKYSSKFVDNVNEDHDHESSKRTISTAFAQLEEEYGSEFFDADEVFDSIGLLTETTLLTFAPFLLLNSGVVNTSVPNAQAPSPCFQILGIDILLDSGLQPHLLEVNHHPSLLTDAPIDMLVKSLLARHVLRMVAYPFARDNAKRLIRKTKKKKSAKEGAKKPPAPVVDPKRPWRTSVAALQENEQDEDSTSSSSSSSSSSNVSDNDDDEQESKSSASVNSKPPRFGAVASNADPEKISISACRSQYENGEPSGWDGRTVPDSQEEWEMLVRGPFFVAFTPQVTERPIYSLVIQPFLRLRDIFAACTGGAASKNRSIDSMNSTRFARFARKFGVCNAGSGAAAAGGQQKVKTMNEIDLMFIRHTKDKGISALRFSDFVWLLLVELGNVLVPNSACVASHDKLKAIVDYLNANETTLI